MHTIILLHSSISQMGCFPILSHISILAGDKTVAMWLMNAELYDGMSTFDEASDVIVRGMALHKMIHAVTMCLGVILFRRCLLRPGTLRLSPFLIMLYVSLSVSGCG